MTLVDLQVIKQLKTQGIHETATAIYTKMQAYLVIVRRYRLCLSLL
ncbi:hypothetical protein EKS18_09995 [Streptococcus mutans]|nr:hypothetical protein [Streptococcus mutans]